MVFEKYNNTSIFDPFQIFNYVLEMVFAKFYSSY